MDEGIQTSDMNTKSTIDNSPEVDLCCPIYPRQTHPFMPGAKCSMGLFL